MADRNLQGCWLRGQDSTGSGRRASGRSFVADGLGVALMPEQITELPHEGVVFRPLSPPLLRESTIAWRADNPSKPLKDYIQIVKELSASI